jgi:hypothetical protein
LKSSFGHCHKSKSAPLNIFLFVSILEKSKRFANPGEKNKSWGFKELSSLGSYHPKRAMGNKETPVGKWDNCGVNVKTIPKINKGNFLPAANCSNLENPR